MTSRDGAKVPPERRIEAWLTAAVKEERKNIIKLRKRTTQVLI